MWTLVLAACLADPECPKGASRCIGGTLERCTLDGGGVEGPIDDPTYVDGTGRHWDLVADCGANRCIEPVDASAFCALDPAPTPACGSAEFACDGTTLVTCNDGYAIERIWCGECDATYGACIDGTGDNCALDSDCGAGLACNDDPYRTCEQTCECPEGAECNECGESWSKARDGGVWLKWTCHAGLCSFHY